MFENLSDCVLPLFSPPLHPFRHVTHVQERAGSDHLLGDLFRHLFPHLPGAVFVQ